ncbi:CDP-alcohol phosphatidyltransferase family protein [Oceanicella actignis]|uniref:CDP-alcohol phosphatidyltransferase family protein n=1 Tax=Oceanicella actignis TaxID=1189325 RepID=UPI001B87806D|nr:CDP-alcohol phosphatidyltransferase family protein [Oceanicella actignis]
MESTAMNDGDRPGQPPSRKEMARAWAVHAFTASGIVLGFLALLAILEGDRVAVFMWLGLALFVDGIDGTLARRARVREVTPQFDGATLDNVVDYFTYVAVPAMMIYWFDLVPQGWETATAAAVMLVSLYTFANQGVKTSDYYFSGFPAVWNIVVLAFHIMQTGPWTNLAVIAACLVLTFVPLKYVHPFRVRAMRPVTIPMTVLWFATTLRLVLVDPHAAQAREAHPLVFALWVASSLYFVAISAWRSLQPDPSED